MQGEKYNFTSKANKNKNMGGERHRHLVFTSLVFTRLIVEKKKNEIKSKIYV